MTIARSLVIFDVEGTLVDSTALTVRCWQETLQSFGFEFPFATLQRHSGEDGHDMLHALLPGPHVGRVVPRIIEAQGQRYRDKYLPRVGAGVDRSWRQDGARGRMVRGAGSRYFEAPH
jgi:beta-phosphoglucomutase-like phosphatase (HAD superfamily)